MVLHAEHRVIPQTEAFERLVVQIDVREFDLAGIERIRVNGEPVIVRSDLDLTSRHVLDRLIAAAMSEFHLVSLGTKGFAK